MTVLTTILTVLAVTLTLLRLLAPHITNWLNVPTVKPEWARWAWAPAAATAFLAFVLQQMSTIWGVTVEFSPEVDRAIATVNAIVQGLVILEGYRARGHVTVEQLAALDQAAAIKTAATAIGKLPPVSLVLLVVLIAGCAPHLERARDAASVRLQREVAAGEQPARDEARCEKLDRNARLWGATAATAASLGSVSGLTSVVIEEDDSTREDERVREGLAIGAVVALGVSAGAGYASARAAERWAGECSR